MNYATRIFSNYYIPSLQISNVIEIAFMAFVLYYVLLWIKNTRAFALMRGLIILAVGAGLSVAKIEPWADYVLIAGAVVVIIRGFVRNHED